ncbi:hypothetical protein U1Q18_021255 [Sarracenia purpurea var. burkii]
MGRAPGLAVQPPWVDMNQELSEMGLRHPHRELSLERAGTSDYPGGEPCHTRGLGLIGAALEARMSHPDLSGLPNLNNKTVTV